MIPEDFPHLERQEERLTRAMSHLPARTHERIRAALAFAREAHAGQVRAGVSRVPYIIHPLRVACTLVDEFGVRNADAVVAALLHDVVEDCGVTPEAIGERFGYTVRRYVAALTWQKGSRNEKWALAASILRQPYTVRMIKAADVIDNSRATWEVRDRARLLRWIYEYGHWGRRIVESVGAPATLMLDAALRKTTSFHFGNDPEPALPPNNGKSLTIKLSILNSQFSTLARYPLRTHVVTASDDITELVRRYAAPHLRPGDLLAISERVVAITQGRAFRIEDIHPSWWARCLVRFVHKSPYGIGLGSAWTMELAIREAGLPRMLFAAFASAITKPFGIRGVFYRVVGNDINAIDGPCDYTLPPYNGYAKLGPKDPNGVAEHLAREIGVAVAIIDANDLGVNILGASTDVDRVFVAAAFRDNPLGQTKEQTPMAIVRTI